MQNDLVFDSLEYSKRALHAGLSQAEAEFHAGEFSRLVNDVIVTRADLSQEFQIFEARMRSLYYQSIFVLIGGISALVSIFEFIFHKS